MTIAWNDSYLIGDDAVDAQHQQLFKLANRFLAATDKASLTLCAMQLYKYTREHFEYEEALMRKFSFPDHKAHMEGHNRLIARLNLVGKCIENDTLNKQELEEFITDWALHHIPNEDARLASYVKGQP